jgi:hypothetical protein
LSTPTTWRIRRPLHSFRFSSDRTLLNGFRFQPETGNGESWFRNRKWRVRKSEVDNKGETPKMYQSVSGT